VSPRVRKRRDSGGATVVAPCGFEPPPAGSLTQCHISLAHGDRLSLRLAGIGEVGLQCSGLVGYQLVD
jgi:hypothetical protein